MVSARCYRSRTYGRDGMGPVILRDRPIARKGFAPPSMSHFGLRAVAKAAGTAATYDCVNVSSLVCFEYVLRRLRVTVGAHACDAPNPYNSEANMTAQVERPMMGLFLFAATRG